MKLFVNGRAKRSKGIKGCRLNAALYWMYRRENLHDKPLYVIGNRKVDRGLGFHFAPRRNDAGEFDPIAVEFESAEFVSMGGDGLIFTDEILGQIHRQETAAQKAGRCAGIIAQSPNYCGNVHYWTDNKTAELIRAHNAKVDQMNGLAGAYTARQADARARSQLAQQAGPPKRIYNRSLHPFSTAERAKEWFNSLNMKREVKCQDKSVVEKDYKCGVYGMYYYNTQNELVRLKDPNIQLATHIQYEGETILIPTLEEFMSRDFVEGTTTNARVMPVRVNGIIQFMVIYKNYKQN
jgi:hypothetical protein